MFKSYRLAALGLDYSFGDECMFLKKDNDKQRLYFKDLYGICMTIQGCHYEPGAGDFPLLL